MVIDFVDRVLNNFYERLNVMPPTSDEELERYLNRACDVGLLDHDEIKLYLKHVKTRNERNII
jgi:hypothetical protein